MKSRNKDAKNEFGPLFSRLYSLFSAILPSSRRFYSTIVDDMEIDAESRILDVGCGSGNLMALISKHVPSAKIFGVDPSEGMISAARKRTGRLRRGGSISLEIGNCSNIPFPGSFNLIVSTLSYHHWEDQKSCLDHLASLLDDRGVLYIYERYAGEGRKEKSSKELHSLSFTEAETMQISSLKREIKIIGQIIAVKFRN